ncbi:maltose/moltooligosaccharide transporter [Flavobacterium sp. CF108]|uniref:MFS transporter n=1 Tax=unclassified Flavobacterium TaxID=196869 RepID=UPI0008C07171|nr:MULTISPECIES: MFS transporter [unclassified Flavobacterium]SEN51434.1 maltose/moltooligosaccharide transporter [Flavobacterium sp. fv08]SHG97605.1 maltose/moltooligosaccharide transporter [Flavobacterium sp. CF108]
MEKRKLSFWEIWNMSFGFLGIQFGFALQNANTSRIFETLGAKIDDIPILWIAAPVSGLIIQPVIGYFSDRTWTRLGRRRPYFLIGAILSSIALFVMPNSPTLWIAAGTLWIMDASINVSMEPFRAFVGDNLPDEQRALGFVMQSFFIGTGAVVGSILPYLFANLSDLNNVAPKGIIPDTVKWSFYIGGIIFLLSVLWTVFKTTEYTPEELLAFEANSKKNTEDISNSETESGVTIQKQLFLGLIFAAVGGLVSFLIFENSLAKELYILFIGLIFMGVLFVIASQLRTKKVQNGFTIIMTDLLNMPKTMQKLAWVQFFSWFALFSMWIYTTQAVTTHLFHTTDTTSKVYNDAADWVSVLFTVYNGVAAAVAFLLPVIAKKVGIRATHLLALCAGGIGLISIYFIGNKQMLILPMLGVGIAWASILSMPYAMLSGALPAAKMGYYMGVFNFFVVIPQIVAATILGFVIKQFFHNEPIYALIIGGVSMIFAGLLTLRVNSRTKIEIHE